MKKILIIAVALFAFNTITNAQGLQFGAKLGANLGKVDGRSFKEEYNLSYHAGAFLEIDINKKFGIQPEVYFNQTQTTRSSSFDDIYNQNPNAKTDLKLNYLTIPILVRYTVLNNLLTLNAGPQYSILINDNEDLLANGKSAFKKGDFALAAGAQLNLKRLRVYARYNIGLSDINDIDNQDEWKNQTLQVGLGLRLFKL